MLINAKLEAAKEFPGFTDSTSDKTYKALVAALRPGVTFWRVVTWYGQPNGIDGPYTIDKTEFEYGSYWIYCPNPLSVRNMQNVNGKAVFLSEKAAVDFLALAKAEFASDLNWQIIVKDRKEEEYEDIY